MFEKYITMYQQCSATFMILVVMSILTLGIGLERLVFIIKALQRLRVGRREILAHLAKHHSTMAQAINISLPQHLATQLFDNVLNYQLTTINHIKRLQNQILRQLRKRLWVLGSIGAIAPFVGLLGTVLGVMDAFRAMGEQGTGGFAVVSSGISEALVTTAAGIFVGVESVLLFNYLQVCVNQYAAELRESVDEIGEHTSEVKHELAAPAS